MRKGTPAISMRLMRGLRFVLVVAVLAVGGTAKAALGLEATGKATPVFAFPNPAHPAGGDKVTIRFPAQRAATVRLYSLAGELVAILRAPEVQAEAGLATWNGRNGTGYLVTSGVYLFVVTGSRNWVGKLTILN